MLIRKLPGSNSAARAAWPVVVADVYTAIAAIWPLERRTTSTAVMTAVPNTGPRTVAGSVARVFPAGDNAPTIDQRKRLGIAISSTASNAPTIAAITAVAASATA